MRKQNSGNRRSAAGRKSAPKTVDEYLARVPEPARGTLNKIRAAIHASVPPETAEIVSYGIPAFKYKQVLVWFAAFADHCSLFPTAAVIEAFKDELKGYSISKGTIQFPTGKPLPNALVKKMVKARLAAIEKKRYWVSLNFFDRDTRGQKFKLTQYQKRRGVDGIGLWERLCSEACARGGG